MFYFQSSVKKYLKYPSLPTTITVNQCQFVKSSALYRSIQTSCPYYKHPNIILSGPSSQLGLNNVSLCGTQNHKHINNLMNFFRIWCITCLHLSELIEGHKVDKLCVGTLLSKKNPVLDKYITRSWIKNT